MRSSAGICNILVLIYHFKNLPEQKHINIEQKLQLFLFLFACGWQHAIYLVSNKTNIMFFGKRFSVHLKPLSSFLFLIFSSSFRKCCYFLFSTKMIMNVKCQILLPNTIYYKALWHIFLINWRSTWMKKKLLCICIWCIVDVMFYT